MHSHTPWVLAEPAALTSADGHDRESSRAQAPRPVCFEGALTTRFWNRIIQAVLSWLLHRTFGTHSSLEAPKLCVCITAAWL